MSKKLYLNGCSYTFGLHLEKEDTLAHLFSESAGYQVTNNSRPGKSNMAIALDTFNSIKNHDTIVLGWTYASRSYLKYNGYNIDLLASRLQIELPHDIDTNNIESTYTALHKQFYSLYDAEHFNNVSDMLMTSTYHLAKSLGKKMVFFSWEKRSTNIPVYYPHIPSSYRLPDSHLNVAGTMYLYNTLQGLINE